MAQQRDIQASADTEVAAALRLVLADTYRLVGKTQTCHWNVTGPNFVGLHMLFEKQYRALFEAIDELAERLRALGAPAPMSIARLLEESRLPEGPDDVSNEGSDMARMLSGYNRQVSDAARAAAQTAEAAGDPATHDLLVARCAAHDKAAWMLRAAAGQGAR